MKTEQSSQVPWLANALATNKADVYHIRASIVLVEIQHRIFFYYESVLNIIFEYSKEYLELW